MVEQIATASGEQAAASKQISRNVEGISAVASQTASGTQQIARTAEDLNRLNEKLQSLVAAFTLDKDDRPVGQVRRSPDAMLLENG
jgi:methyl-accepting chemotaxis protein